MTDILYNFNTAVPVKPTIAMVQAGMRVGGVNADIVWRIFAAMVEASRQEPTELPDKQAFRK